MSEATVSMGNATRGGRTSAVPFALILAAAVGGGLWLSFMAGPSFRAAILSATLAAGVGGIIALAAQVIAHAAPPERLNRAVLSAFGAGFLTRMVLVGAALVVARPHTQPAALAFAATFFAIWLASQLVEIAYVWAGAQARPRP